MEKKRNDFKAQPKKKIYLIITENIFRNLIDRKNKKKMIRKVKKEENTERYRWRKKKNKKNKAKQEKKIKKMGRIIINVN